MSIKHPWLMPLFFVGLLSCQLSVEHTPKDLTSVSADIPKFTVKGPVRVVNGQTPSRDEIVETRTRKLSVNYSQYSDSAVELISKAIMENGGTLSDHANKSLTVSVTNLTITQSLTNVRATIDATVVLGSGSLRGYHAQSAGTVESAVDQAIQRVVVHVLSNKEVRAYLTE